MESFSPGRSHQTEHRWKWSNGEGDPRFWLSGARSPPRPCLLEMWDRKRGDNKTSHMEIRNYYQSWSDISLVGLSLQPLRSAPLPGRFPSLLLFQQQVPATDEAYPSPISQLRDAAGSPREGILLNRSPQSCSEGSVFSIPPALGRTHPAERAGEASPAHGPAAPRGTINLYELEQPLLEVTAPGPARELIPDLLSNKHQTLPLFRYLECGPALPKVFGSRAPCSERLSPGAV